MTSADDLDKMYLLLDELSVEYVNSTWPHQDGLKCPHRRGYFQSCPPPNNPGLGLAVLRHGRVGLPLGSPPTDVAASGGAAVGLAAPSPDVLSDTVVRGCRVTVAGRCTGRSSGFARGNRSW